MKPMFTVHPGEYLVGLHIEEAYKNWRVWLPSKDTGVDLLVTNRQLTHAVSLQVKFSKDFLGSQGEGKSASKDAAARIKSGGWWTFNPGKMRRSSADVWVLVLHSFSHKASDFVLIEPLRLLALYRRLHRTPGTIQSYLWVTENEQCWETRGLRKAEQDAISAGEFKDPARNFTGFLNNWKYLAERLGPA